MNLNNIRFSARQVADLYNRDLIASEPGEGPEGPAAAQPEPESLTFLGQHARGILVVNSDPAAVYLSDEDLAVLTKMLEPNGFSLADVAIINWHRLPAQNGTALTERLGSQKVLLFGLTPEAFGLPALFPPFQVQPLGGRSYLHAPPLATLARADKEVKITFWNALRKLLGVS